MFEILCSDILDEYLPLNNKNSKCDRREKAAVKKTSDPCDVDMLPLDLQFGTPVTFINITLYTVSLSVRSTASVRPVKQLASVLSFYIFLLVSDHFELTELTLFWPDLGVCDMTIFDRGR